MRNIYQLNQNILLISRKKNTINIFHRDITFFTEQAILIIIKIKSPNMLRRNPAIKIVHCKF